ncbi:MAG: hypothetical protein IID38_09965, partial [Planctomycetes bacterium]|nr:hypothetical protein [Planctomycetota bacterium]
MQAKKQPEYPRLYSIQGFFYCDLLVGEAQRAAWHIVVGRCLPDEKQTESPIRADLLKNGKGFHIVVGRFGFHICAVKVKSYHSRKNDDKRNDKFQTGGKYDTFLSLSQRLGTQRPLRD